MRTYSSEDLKNPNFQEWACRQYLVYRYKNVVPTNFENMILAESFGLTEEEIKEYTDNLKIYIGFDEELSMLKDSDFGKYGHRLCKLLRMAKS